MAKIEKTNEGASMKISSDAFDKQTGETSGPIQVLKLEPGEAAGPFVLVEVKENYKGSSKKAASLKETTAYIATFNGIRIGMPLAAAFVKKAKDFNLAIGDNFLVKRVGDYVSAMGTTGKGYELKITQRAAK